MNLEDDPSTELETGLKRALRRESPPLGFASRVLQRIERDQKPKRRPSWQAIAASLTLTALIGAGAAYEHQRREGERAKEQVLEALHIASEKVRYAQTEVRTIGSRD